MTRERKANSIGRRALAAALFTLASLTPHAAQAQSQIGSFSSFSSGANSKKPIDIESDRLEVDDKNHTAIFIGNVSATQGDNNLKAPRLEVFYENASQQPAGKGTQTAKAAKPAAASTGASSDPLTSGQIKRIHAMGGKVVVTSVKDNQEATGDDAIYDVKAQLVTMTGKEVVLSQNQNKVKGTKFVIDLTTGKATVINEGAGTASSGRIRAVFQQQTGADGKPINPLANTNPKGTSDPKQAAPAQKAAPPPQGAASPWQTQSR